MNSMILCWGSQMVKGIWKNKGGLGYKPKLKQKYCKNYFVKATSVSDHKVVCHYCNRNGHLSYAYFGIKTISVPKGTIANT